MSTERGACSRGMFYGHFDWDVELVWTVDHLLSPEECDGILARTSGTEWLSATVNGPDGRYVNERIRNNSLALLRDTALCSALFDRLRPVLPPMFGATPKQLHPTLRVYRYEVGQHFGLHSDQPYFDEDGDQSRLTLIVYLDEGCEGGETVFPELGRTIIPRTGRALLFQHMALHEGRPVLAGQKHLLRTDVIYR